MTPGGLHRFRLNEVAEVKVQYFSLTLYLYQLSDLVQQNVIDVSITEGQQIPSDI